MRVRLLAIFVLFISSSLPATAQGGLSFSGLSSLLRSAFSSENVIYKSTPSQVSKPSDVVYEKLSSFENMYDIASQYVSQYTATEDECSFKVKGITIRLRIARRIAGELVEVTSVSGSPFRFTARAYITSTSRKESTITTEVEATLNSALKMVFDAKLRSAVEYVNKELANQLSK